MENGRPVRRGTFIDIPFIYDSPHFAKDESDLETDDLHGHFVLRLESFICHQGNTTDSGHYISVVRSPGNNSDADRWLLMDDLAKERISYINDIREFLNREQPYLLFYGVEPVSPDPPPYRESVGHDSGVAGLSDTQGRYSLDSALNDCVRGRASDERRRSLALSEAAVNDSNTSSARFFQQTPFTLRPMHPAAALGMPRSIPHFEVMARLRTKGQACHCLGFPNDYQEKGATQHLPRPMEVLYQVNKLLDCQHQTVQNPLSSIFHARENFPTLTDIECSRGRGLKIRRSRSVC